MKRLCGANNQDSVYRRRESKPVQCLLLTEVIRYGGYAYTLDNLVIDRREALYGLDSNKAQGIDSIGPRILRSCANTLCVPLHHLFQLTLTTHTLPREWKWKTHPIFKSGDRSHANNYRPLSLLCCSSKVLERILYNKCINFKISSNTGFL